MLTAHVCAVVCWPGPQKSGVVVSQLYGTLIRCSLPPDLRRMEGFGADVRENLSKTRLGPCMRRLEETA